MLQASIDSRASGIERETMKKNLESGASFIVLEQQVGKDLPTKRGTGNAAGKYTSRFLTAVINTVNTSTIGQGSQDRYVSVDNNDCIDGKEEALP
jgi:hypothetical protein